MSLIARFCEQGSVADIAWVGADEPFLLSSSSDMTVTLWQKDGARIGDFGKDEWRLRDETTWITRGSEEMIADPNAGTKDKGNSDEQIKSILRVPSSHTARPGQKPPRE